MKSAFSELWDTLPLNIDGRHVSVNGPTIDLKDCRTKRFKSMGRYGEVWVSRTKLATKAGGGGGSSGAGGGTI